MDELGCRVASSGIPLPKAKTILSPLVACASEERLVTAGAFGGAEAIAVFIASDASRKPRRKHRSPVLAGLAKRPSHFIGL